MCLGVGVISTITADIDGSASHIDIDDRGPRHVIPTSLDVRDLEDYYCKTSISNLNKKPY